MNAAINQLRAFVNQIEALILSGDLEQADGDEIIGLTQFVIDELSG